MAIDANETRNTLFGGLKKSSHPQKKENAVAEETKNSAVEEKEYVSTETKAINRESTTPKWLNLDKVTVLLTTKQKEGLDRVAKKIMKYRSRDLKGNDSKERITANTLIRSLIENFLLLENDLQMEILSSEEDVHEWIKRIFNRNS